MAIERREYVNLLMQKRWNGKVKIVTGIRRCGKSFLLNTLFKQRLLEEGTPEDSFVELALDRKTDLQFRNPNLLYDFVLEQTKDTKKKYYVMIDEIQLSYKVKNTNIDESLVPEEDKDMLFTTFYDVLNDLMVRSNLDIMSLVQIPKCYQRISSPILETVAQKLEYLLCPLKSFSHILDSKKQMHLNNTSCMAVCL